MCTIDAELMQITEFLYRTFDYKVERESIVSAVTFIRERGNASGNNLVLYVVSMVKREYSGEKSIASQINDEILQIPVNVHVRREIGLNSGLYVTRKHSGS